MFNTSNIFHPLSNLSRAKLPRQFNFPFYYEPHPLCIEAAEEVQCYLQNQSDFEHNFGISKAQKGLATGKMFGVMLVKAHDGSLGYLASFSGKLGEMNYLDGFVPPIFDTLNPNGFYKKGEERLNQMTTEIDMVLKSKDYQYAKVRLHQLQNTSETEINALKKYLKAQKMQRDQKRQEARLHLTHEELKIYNIQLDRESIALQYKLKQLKADWATRLNEAKKQFNTIEKVVMSLKTKRKKLSAKLQRQLHQRYSFLNARGERKDLLDIFEVQPPAAAGECAAPKLFQYAYEHKLKPLAMAEFWWGASPPSEVRKHKGFYPSCRSKCEPILGHMMQGLVVEPNPMNQTKPYSKKLDVVFEDDYVLLINKPPEFLSVPGKSVSDSVYTRVQNYLPRATGPLLVHRLDMSTSGLLLVAKNEKTYKNLQKQFIDRQIKKRYVAVLDGEIDTKTGTIQLPLRVDLNNRPRQLVCYTHGKAAVTHYEVISVEEGKTRIYFYPVTGRTHQLRVHAAHHRGLGTPIIGDDLYGRKGNRLCLHAEFLGFEHPVTKKPISFTLEGSF